jgi:hypothetical protein
VDGFAWLATKVDARIGSCLRDARFHIREAGQGYDRKELNLQKFSNCREPIMSKRREEGGKGIGRPRRIVQCARVTLLCISMILSACGRPVGKSASFRYKLTLSVNTPDGVKTAFNVVELDYETVKFPMSGTPHNVHGQGLYLDLGPGRPPLIAMLTRIPRPEDNLATWSRMWRDDSPAYIIAKHCHIEPTGYQIELVEQIRLCHGPINLTAEELPELVTFSDIQDPESAKSVNPANLSASLGPEISWQRKTIEITDEPITKDITDHLSIARFRNKLVHIDGVNSCCGYADGIILSELIRE